MSKIKIYKNLPIDLGTKTSQCSSVCEPSVANNGKSYIYTGNWFTSQSKDDGKSWKYMSPYSYLPPPSTSFCCDQTCIYDPSRDLTFWILQYSANSSGENTLRIAVNKGASGGFNDWYWWDLTPTDAHPEWSGQWYDYNHAALSDNYLYVGTNVFNASDRWTRCVILRIPLEELADKTTGLQYDYYESTRHGSLRCTQGATDTMYFAAHDGSRYLRVYKWPEKSSSVSMFTVKVNSYNATSGNYSAPGPDGKNWLSRCDRRITGGWISKGIMGFMWSVDKKGERSYPHIKVARINVEKETLIDQPDIWSKSQAFAYPNASPNKNGDVGITLFRGGGNYYPSHVVGVWDEQNGRWKLTAAANGTDGPEDESWGDYLTCRAHSHVHDAWIATGYRQKDGKKRTDVEPRLVCFGWGDDPA